MSGLEEIVTEGSKKDGSSGVGNVVEEGLTVRTQDRRGSHCDLNITGENTASSRGPTAGGENGDVGLGGPQQAMNGPGNKARRNQEDLRAEFYEHYRKEAKEYDDEFMKKHDVDLNTTLIFAGLFSAVTSTFITQVQPGLQPDPNNETAALLRVLIHKIDNTTFGGDAPALPQWTGPPRTAILVQCLLYASLAASILAAFLAMLGKQWLNRYASVNMRGSAIERSQNRQRKLDGIAAWYFEHVMESLPLMLQAALLLLGSALSRYLWEINTTVASVVAGVTSFGLLFYLFIVVVGTTFESCPYQTPWTNIIRGTVRHAVGLLRSAYVLFVTHSCLHDILSTWWRDTAQSVVGIIILILTHLPILLVRLAIDAFLLGRAALRPLVGFAGRARGWLFRTTPALVRGPNDQVTKLDFHCISWMLRTSLDKTINVSTLNYLGTILTLPDLDPAVVVDCFNVFSNCVVVDGRRVATVSRGSEQVAAISAAYILRALFRSSSAKPRLTATGRVPRWCKVFPPHTNLDCLPFLKVVKYSSIHPREWVVFSWERYCPSTDELVPFARAMAQVAQVEYHRREGKKPEILRVLVRFALRFLSQDPLPPTSVIVDCLTVVATDLGCDVSDTNAVTQDENVQLERIVNLIIQEYDSIASSDPVQISMSGREAMIAFLSYMAQREEADQVFPISLKYVILDAFRDNREFMWHASSIDAMMRLWITTAAAVPYADDICRTMVDALLQMARDNKLWPHIPVLAWDWLKKRPHLYTRYKVLLETEEDIVLKVRKLGDAELTTSYLFVIWSEWGFPSERVRTAILDVIREEFSGVGAARYRADLIQRLDYILSQFDGGWECIHHRYPSYAEHDIPRMKQQYEEFREALLEADT